MKNLDHILKFYFITDDNAPGISPLKQVKTAVSAGATVVQYRCKKFCPEQFGEVEEIRDVCRRHGVPLIINDDILLAKAVDADGVHLGQDDEHAFTARQVMGPDALIGISVSTLVELASTDLSCCDYIGAGPVFGTDTKADAKPVIGLSGLQAIVETSGMPVVAIGGIDVATAKDCLRHSAAGVAVISCITRADDPAARARELGKACGCFPKSLKNGWHDEFQLIDKLTVGWKRPGGGASKLRVAPGDDAALFETIDSPVVTTDTQKENIHFRRAWQTLAEIGQKAVEITFSDLAASYASPLSLFVNLSLPPYLSDSDIEEVYAGIGRVLEKYQACLGGGNVASGREFSIDLFAIGRGHPTIFPLRSNARPGDGLYVTGPLGMARAGLACLRQGETAYPELIEKFKRPVARFDAAEILAEHNVLCVMDISDGLAGDAAHIADAANLSIRFEPAFFRISPSLESFCRNFQTDPLNMMMAGGEDYELMFSCSRDTFEQIQTRLPEAFQVGYCEKFSGMPVMNVPDGVTSFQHGRF